MCTSLLAPHEWAHMEFMSSELGDSRRTDRLVEVAGALAKTQSGTLPKAFCQPDQLKAAYRLFDTEEVTFERIVSPHWQRTYEECCQPGEYLLIEDTTALDFKTHPAVRGLGPISDDAFSQGMLLHSTLALRVESWDEDQQPQVTLQGLLHQQCWTRSKQKRRGKKSRPKILRRDRESQRWARSLEWLRPGAESHWTFIADRESDIYEAFQRCNEAQTDFVIRAAQARTLEEEGITVFAAVEKAPVMGSFELELRGRGDRPKRIAKLELRSTTVTLRAPWRPGGELAPFEVQVVLVREVGGPLDESIEWVLLTSLSCQSFEEVRRIVARYARRWIVEEYHKALKTGTQIESSQLESAHRLQGLLGILSLVALRLLNTKLVARATPDVLVDEESFGVEAIKILNVKFGKPAGGWTYGALIVAIARMGGFLARRSDGNPGWITIWRGWEKLYAMAEGIQLMERCG